MRVAFFGSSLVSAWWNGAATYYRGVIRAMHARGHTITFYEPAVQLRRGPRELPDPCARVRVWQGEEGMVRAVLDARKADLVVKGSGIGVRDIWLEDAVLALRAPHRQVAYWDVDPPATLARVWEDAADSFRSCIPRYDVVFTYGGGPLVVDAYTSLGARRCVPICNAHDPDTHHPVAPDPRFHATLGLLLDRHPDREERVERYFFQVARALPDRTFLLGGSGWDGASLPPNVRAIGHVWSHDHNAFLGTPLAVLDLAGDGALWSPGARVFEAAAAGACAVTDGWDGVGDFFVPGEEILVADGPDDIVAHLRRLTAARARAVGDAARRRVLQQHTYDHRALEIDQALLPLLRVA